MQVRKLLAKKLDLEGEAIVVSEGVVGLDDMVIETKMPKTLLHKLAKSYIPHFNYSTYYSNQESASMLEDELSSIFTYDADLYLTRLEYLRQADIMIGHDWLQDDPSLLEIYPWHLHLYNFVDSFRSEYRNSRGRL